MQKSKLVFSATELQLASDSRWILTKNDIIDKIYVLFGNLSEDLVQVFQPLQHVLPEVTAASPKISKGEKYLDLPWVMLDYPRHFKPDPGHFAIRTFFWWGNYFLVQGLYSHGFIPKIVNHLGSGLFPTHIQGFPVYAGFTKDPWDNTFPQASLHALDGNHSAWNATDGFFKIAVCIPVTNWNQVQEVAKMLAEKIAAAWES